ncbi:MAG: cupin domain-containing protein [Acidobacteriia bacterium]|nr:cupin domain-containing protein [Terriglobia bacterium]
MTRRIFELFSMAPLFQGRMPAQSPVKTDERNLPRDYAAATPKPVPPQIVAAEEKAWQQVQPGLRRKAWFNDRLTMVLLEFTRQPGAKPAPQHYHAHDQMSYVMEGRIKAMVGGKASEIGVGGVFIAPSNTRHGIEMLTDRVVLLDVFTPVREDFRA